MLSAAAFNALLKTLEEPPGHVKFIFATTEPHKLPDTILSRCQRHDFRRIPAARMLARLKEIATEEKVDALRRRRSRSSSARPRAACATRSRCSTRCSPPAAPRPTDEDVAEALGAIDRTVVQQIAERPRPARRALAARVGRGRLQPWASISGASPRSSPSSSATSSSPAPPASRPPSWPRWSRPAVVELAREADAGPARPPVRRGPRLGLGRRPRRPAPARSRDGPAQGRPARAHRLHPRAPRPRGEAPRDRCRARRAHGRTPQRDARRSSRSRTLSRLSPPPPLHAPWRAPSPPARARRPPASPPSRRAPQRRARPRRPPQA